MSTDHCPQKMGTPVWEWQQGTGGDQAAELLPMQSVTCQALQSTELLSYGMSYTMRHILREADRGSSGLHLL